MKRPGDELFMLISTMSGSEKRYFRLTASPYSGKEQGSKYVQLFDRIAAQKEYDEQELKKHFRGDALLGKHFKKAKAHLYSLVLGTLCRYQSDEHAQLHRQLHQARLLLKRGLFAQSRKMLSKAKKNAMAQENFTALIEACELERSLIASSRAYRDPEALQLPAQVSSAIEKLSNLLDIRALEGEVFRHFSQHYILRTAQQRRKLERIGRALLKHPAPRSAKAASILYNTLGTYYKQLGDNEKARQCFRKVLGYFSAPRNESEAMNNVMMASNYISACNDMGKYSDALKEMDRVQLVCDRYPDNKRLRQVLCNLCHTIMSMFISRGEFRMGIDFAEKVRERYFSDAVLHDRVLLKFNLSVLFFGTGNYQQAIVLSNDIINLPESENPIPKTSYWSRMLQLIAFWEAGEQDLLSYRLRSFYQYMRKRRQLYKFEKTVLDFVRENYEKDGGETRRAFVQLKKQLASSLRTPGEANALEYFDFISWLESKIQERPFAEVVKEKAR